MISDYVYYVFEGFRDIDDILKNYLIVYFTFLNNKKLIYVIYLCLILNF